MFARFVAWLLTIYITSGLHRWWIRRCRLRDLLRVQRQHRYIFKPKQRTLVETLRLLITKKHYWRADSWRVLWDWLPVGSYLEEALLTRPHKANCDCGAFATWIYESINNFPNKTILLVVWKEFDKPWYKVRAHYLCSFETDFFDSTQRHIALSNWGMTGPSISREELFKSICGQESEILRVWEIDPNKLTYNRVI